MAFLLLLGGCTPAASDGPTASTSTSVPDGSSSTTTPPGDTATTIPPTPVFADDDEAIPLDPAVLTGVLDNGLTYYVLENDNPGGRARLRLVVEAGSVLEQDHQLGAAHFLEHMMFNGTERFPANELVRVLQRFGAAFGPDINAYTTFDETVYTLQVPTDDPATVDTALDVLHEWATAVTIDPAEVENERGVLIEEHRLRTEGFAGRYDEAVRALLLGGTGYAERSPGASPSAIRSITAEALREFYVDWYRPDLMAVVAVGDFDPGRVQASIVERFGGLVGPVDPPERPDVTIEPAVEPTFLVLADPETTTAWAELNYPLPAIGTGTIGRERRSLAMRLAFSIVVTRLGRDARRGTAPFYEGTFASNPFVDTQITPGLGALAEPPDLGASARALLTEVERVLTHGFTAVEVAEAVTDVRREVELEFDGAESRQDALLADRLVAHFLGSGTLPDPEEGRDLRLRLLEEMTPGIVAAVFADAISSTEPLVIIVGPNDAADVLPTDGDLAALLADVRAAVVEPRPADGEAATTLMARPDPAEVVERTTLAPTDAVVLRLENGARVVHLPTDIALGSVVLGAYSDGGWSLLPIGDVAEAQLSGDLVAGSGVADLDSVELQRFLAGKAVELYPAVGETEETLFGWAGTADLEILFQLVHLFLTQPRVEEAALARLLGELRPLAASPERVPELAAFVELTDLRYRGDPRFLPIPPLEELDTFDLDRSLEVFRERFADAGDFVFAVVGDFDPGLVEDLSRRYLGTLPSTGERETFTDVQPDPPPGVVSSTIEAGSADLALLLVSYTAELELDAVSSVELDVLRAVVEQRLVEEIREVLGATYAPAVTMQPITEPDHIVETIIDFSTDPREVDEVAAALRDVVSAIRSTGPTADELDIATEQVRRAYELFSNEQLVEILARRVLHPDEQDMTELGRRIGRLDDVTVEDIRGLAVRVLREDRSIEVRVVPPG